MVKLKQQNDTLEKDDTNVLGGEKFREIIILARFHP